MWPLVAGGGGVDASLSERRSRAVCDMLGPVSRIPSTPQQPGALLAWLFRLRTCGGKGGKLLHRSAIDGRASAGAIRGSWICWARRRRSPAWPRAAGRHASAGRRARLARCSLAPSACPCARRIRRTSTSARHAKETDARARAGTGAQTHLRVNSSPGTSLSISRMAMSSVAEAHAARSQTCGCQGQGGGVAGEERTRSATAIPAADKQQ